MLKEGIEIKDYTLKRFLGRGGFGEVWLAEKKIEIADKKVSFALKFLSGDNQSLSEFSSVRREINTWIEASGNNNVVSVLDGFIHQNYFVIVSEYADGGSLRQWLRNSGGKSPSIEKTVELMGGILDGLSHLHARKIVHRDLKPENILLKGEMPCIADFGVSKMVETVSLTSSQLGTNSAGSPLYMSPESFERIKPAPQIDVWSAGVILFEMLSGKTPYTADTIPALIFEIVTKEPRQLPASVSLAMRNVVKKSLEKNVSERFQTAKEMKDALMKALYMQDYTPINSPSELVLTLKHSAENISPKTLPLQATKTIEKKKYGTFIGLGAGAVLVTTLGIIGVTQFPPQNRLNQSNVTNSNQIVKPQEATFANSENVNAVKSIEEKTPRVVEKQKENVHETKPKPNQSPRLTLPPKEIEVFPAKPIAPANTKKKTTLDDLLNKN